LYKVFAASSPAREDAFSALGANRPPLLLDRHGASTRCKVDLYFTCRGQQARLGQCLLV